MKSNSVTCSLWGTWFALAFSLAPVVGVEIDKRSVGVDAPSSDSVSEPNQTVYKPFWPKPQDPPPRLLGNQPDDEKNPLNRYINTLHHGYSTLLRCGPGAPCANGACCSTSGYCAFGPEFCGADVCISNCEAKAECGQFAEDDLGKCALNACCVRAGPRPVHSYLLS